MKKQFCINKHEIAIVGRDKTGHCKGCISEKDRSEYNRAYYELNRETELTRRKKYREEHKEQVNLESAEYYTTHADEIHRKRKEKYDPQVAHAYYEINKKRMIAQTTAFHKTLKGKFSKLKAKAKNQTNRNLRIVAWTDWDKIKEVYKNCPKGMEVDHIIPLQGKLVSGLHVSWNLQYLCHSENSSKQNRIDLIEASKLYGTILEHIGLK